MASALLGMSARRGSAFRRVFSEAAAAATAPSDREGLAVRRAVSLPPRPLRRLTHSGAQGVQPPKSLEEKVDDMLQRVKEIDQQFEQNLTEVIKWHKEELRTADHDGYFERFFWFLIKIGMTKGKYGDDFIWCCELATLFALSAGFGYLLAYVKTAKTI